MSIAEGPCSAIAEEPLVSALSGLELQHDLYLALPSSAAWGAVAEALCAVGAELQSLQLLRQSEGYSARCRVKSVTSEAARRISGILLESGVARHASVEHLMLRTAGERAP